MLSLLIYYGSGFVLVTITEIQKYIYTIVQQDANMKMKHDLLKKINVGSFTTPNRNGIKTPKSNRGEHFEYDS
ncbi:hypothetical protein D3C76_976750 [compost metagenome]